ncbi:SIMPL domain-containing protein [Tundrisphaera lichenicola]|uniref:SIMPL domain-containing protein n=1 Tax=Tundrisphaera lichenicola TaxID=2029860 RepID=UPI003EB8014F
MRLVAISLMIFTLSGRVGLAQVGGNVGYGQAGGRARAEQNERSQRQLTREEMPPTDSSMFIDASVLMNVKADEFVATFSVAEQAETVQECQAKMDATIASFTGAIQGLGIGPESVFVDFAAQTKVYGYKIEGNLAKEQLSGFELKKTVAIRYRDKTLIDRLVVAASRSKVYDLAKVDYIVSDPGPVQERLAEEAAAVIKAKVARHERLLGIQVRPVPQIYAERSSAYFPTEMYESYVAGESEAVEGAPDRSRLTVQSLRKSRTFLYNPLDADGFDRVIEPVILEPVVQFTHYLKLKYEIETRR